jgi:hypothetical protein
MFSSQLGLLQLGGWILGESLDYPSETTLFTSTLGVSDGNLLGFMLGSCEPEVVPYGDSILGLYPLGVMILGREPLIVGTNASVTCQGIGAGSIDGNYGTSGVVEMDGSASASFAPSVTYSGVVECDGVGEGLIEDYYLVKVLQSAMGDTNPWSPPITVTAGNILIICASGEGSGTASISDNLGTSYTLIDSVNQPLDNPFGGHGGCSCFMWWGLVTSTGSPTITLTGTYPITTFANYGSGAGQLFLVELFGADTSSPIASYTDSISTSSISEVLSGVSGGSIMLLTAAQSWYNVGLFEYSNSTAMLQSSELIGMVAAEPATSGGSYTLSTDDSGGGGPMAGIAVAINPGSNAIDFDTVAIVQSATDSAGSNPWSTGLTVTGGNMVLVMQSGTQYGTASISDNLSTVYTQITNESGPNTAGLYMWIGVLTSTGSLTITQTGSFPVVGSTGYDSGGVLSVVELSGGNVTSPIQSVQMFEYNGVGGTVGNRPVYADAGAMVFLGAAQGWLNVGAWSATSPAALEVDVSAICALAYVSATAAGATDIEVTNAGGGPTLYCVVTIGPNPLDVSIFVLGAATGSIVGSADWVGAVQCDGSATGSIVGNINIGSDVVEMDGSATGSIVGNINYGSAVVEMDGSASASIIPTGPEYGVVEMDGSATGSIVGNINYGSAVVEMDGSAAAIINGTGPVFGTVEMDGQAASSYTFNVGYADALVEMDGSASVSIIPTGPVVGTFEADGVASALFDATIGYADAVVEMDGHGSASAIPTGPEYGSVEMDGQASALFDFNVGYADAVVEMDGSASGSIVGTGPVYVSIEMDGVGGASVTGNFAVFGSVEMDGAALPYIIGSGPNFGTMISAGAASAEIIPTGPEYGTTIMSGDGSVTITGSGALIGIFECDGVAGVSIIPLGPEYGTFECDGQGGAVLMGGYSTTGFFECDGSASTNIIGSGPVYAAFEADGTCDFHAIPTGPEYASVECDGTSSVTVVAIGPVDGTFECDGQGGMAAMWQSTNIFVGQFQCDGKSGLPIDQSGTLAGNTGGGAGTGGLGGGGTYNTGNQIVPVIDGEPLGSSPTTGVGSGQLPSRFTNTTNFVFGH